MGTTEHVDVVVVGAGLSGIGAGWHLQTNCPDRNYVILEGRDDLGGTWDLFRYPGVRSDSDMHTLGYSFKPWTAETSIADGPAILDYLRETAAEYGIDRHIRFRHLVRRADWDSERARWTVTAERDGEEVVVSCSYLFMCSGYYSYKGGHRPDFPGEERFGGTLVHPQEWPDDLDHRDQRVVIIGSGATAVTLVPAMAADASHVTMLQRSPTYLVSAPDRDRLNLALRRVLPDRVAYAFTRWKNATLGEFFYGQTRTRPERVRKRLLDRVRKELPEGYDVETHFSPRYDPWDQRICLVPNGDFFRAVSDGSASVVTDTIETFTETGIRLTSGQHVEADIIVTATGLELVTLGEMDFTVDGVPVDFSSTWTYKGLAYSDVPNLASTFGYINASWTLRADLVAAYVCRLLDHLRDTGTDICVPRLRPSDRDMPARPWIDDFSSGYMQRMMPMLPKQGDRAPWLNPQRYSRDKRLLGSGPVDDGVMQFHPAGFAASAAPVAVGAASD
jgi:monooxygenase